MRLQMPADFTANRLAPLRQRSELLASLGSFRAFAADIKIAHSVFALPFAMSAFVLGHLPLPSIKQALLLLLCMITARSFAMGINRVLDHRLDQANPRTRGRMIPRGALSTRQGFAWSALAGIVFIAAAFALSLVCGYSAPLLLAVLAMYTLMKRLTWLTHWYLGMCLGLAPIAVSIALTGRAPLAVLLVGIGVCLWTAGFDILYALQDREFDQQHHLHSIPSRFGSATALWVSRCCFAAMSTALILAGRWAGQGPLYYVGVAVVTALLIYEQILVRDAKINGTSPHINLAFFTMNAYVSVIYFAFTALDAYLC